jgi:hypothetical protein
LGRIPQPTGGIFSSIDRWVNWPAGCKEKAFEPPPIDRSTARRIKRNGAERPSCPWNMIGCQVLRPTVDVSICFTRFRSYPNSQLRAGGEVGEYETRIGTGGSGSVRMSECPYNLPSYLKVCDVRRRISTSILNMAENEYRTCMCDSNRKVIIIRALQPVAQCSKVQASVLITT